MRDDPQLAGLPVTPAPWQLQGRGYISLLRFDDQGEQQDRFLPRSLAGRRSRSPYAWLMFVDYRHSEVGPYHELLFIPGSFPFEDGQRHLSISRIFVSSPASVVSGRANWGIPKDLAEFEVRYGVDGLDRVKVSRGGRLFAELDFKSYPLPLPFSGGLIPAGLRTLGQHCGSQSFIYAPSASGVVRPASLRRAWSDAEEFPLLARARPVLTVGVSQFRMQFPVARILPLATP
ncbi:hypothetical protein ED208_10225 [Stagnimonas aquatica]|uniref:Acetoacetate decarboxylase n=1 Tax=Stagnimonas aquatica TaxID=2689987 RepID=A0A3N0V9P6_9GAMM|nr:acetoacetate decarboxylase family protein [Stagnimonas aquatica]ROH89503.1 hypothetical protein ED208_10225 [Stagnimonas aquatica]